ncbi:diguanylate cyclase [Zoogloea sp.]|uniref:diguanylate cyclase domain-containing protein n=1 Tax=Zoogloea sp. TaxID=49181 RepID=UPI00262878E0|nr:diguanylate cyclase [Zoogloea sp.]MDD3352183.1 diguanylate cyclase [Zoogloea sp.]
MASPAVPTPEPVPTSSGLPEDPHHHALETPSDGRHPGQALLPLLVFVVALACTGLLSHSEYTGSQQRLEDNFNLHVRQTAERIENQIATYEQLLRGVRGLFQASDAVSERDFLDYVDALTRGHELEGLQVVAYTPLLRQENTLRGPIAFVAPPTQENKSVKNLDMLAAPVRGPVMLQARDSGRITMTPKTHLLMDKTSPQPGIALYLALYRRGSPTGTLAERQTALQGWVHVAFRVHDLMASLYGSGTPGIGLRIYDGPGTRMAQGMFDSHPEQDDALPSRFTAYREIRFSQHAWTLEIFSTPAFEATQGGDKARLTALSGGFVSLLLALITWQLTTSRVRAHERAHQMTLELRESEERMRHMAQHDPLTRLPNRALFSDRLASALARARRDDTRAALMFVDLDRFKPVNDEYGHGVGDQLLVAASGRMRACLRESDTLARIGGDEFVVLLPQVDTAADAEQVAERIRTALATPFEVASHVLNISCSIGIGLYPDHGIDEVHLMKSADDAMYQAKDAGRNQMAVAG